MSKLTLSSAILVALMSTSFQAFADIKSDCAYLERMNPPLSGMCQRIDVVVNEQATFYAPPPCANKDPGVTFQRGSPAVLSPSDGSCGGGADAGGGGAGSFNMN